MGKLAEKLALATPARQRAILGNLQTLVKSKQLEKYYKLLTDFDFIAAKVQHPDLGVQVLIEDYDLIYENNEKVKALKLIQGALRLSAHILVKDTTQLAGQLSARLLYFDTPEIKNLLHQISEAKNTGLLSLTPSLSPPNGNLISTLSGHLDSVNAVAVTPDGQFIVSGSSDHTVKVWNLNTATEVLTFRGHTSSVNAVAITPDGKKVVSGASDNTVRVWNLETGKEILTFNGHSLPIVAVAITVDGQKVVSASIAKANSIKVWNLETGKEELTLKGHGDLVRTVAITSNNCVISASDNGSIKAWDLTKGKLLWDRTHGHTRYTGQYIIVAPQPVYAIALTPDGKRMVSGSGHSEDRKIIKVWTRKSYNFLLIKFSDVEDFTLKGNTNPISSLAVTSDDKQIVSGSFDNTIKIWDIKSRQEISTFVAHSQSVYDLKVTPDGKKIISASKDNTIKVWNLDQKWEKTQLIRDKKSVKDVTIIPDGKQAFFAFESNLIKIYNLEKQKLISTFHSDHNCQDNFYIRTSKILEKYILLIYLYFKNIFLNIVYILQVLGVLVISLAMIVNYYLLILILVFFVILGIIRVIFFMIFSLSKLVYGDFDVPEYPKNNIPESLWQKIEFQKYSKYADLSLELEEDFEIHKDIRITITPKNLLICTSNKIMSHYRFLTVWNYEKIKRKYDLISISQSCYIYLALLMPLIYTSITPYLFLALKHFFALFIRSQDFVLAPLIVLSLSGLFLYGLLYVLNKKLSSIITFIFYESPTTTSITPDGNYLISGSTKGTINIWSLENKKLLYVLKGHQKKITTLTITPDGKYLISGSDDKTIKIWNLETRKELFTLTGHGNSINTMSVTPNGKHLISGSKDKTIKIWNLENREEIFTFTGHTNLVNSVKVTSDGQLVISASSDKTIQVWEFKTGTVIATFTGESEINCCAVAPDNVTIVAGEEAGNIHFLRLQGFEGST